MANSKKIFRDPIYDLITFEKKYGDNGDNPILKIINSYEFQRLRRIRQLGLCFYTYSSALHDRFSHSIGVCYLIGVLVERLKLPKEEIEIFSAKRKGESVKINKTQLKLLLQLAALLHDIGHGPFSHAFERITNINHEYLTKEVIKSPAISSILHSIEDETLSKYAEEWILDIFDGDFKPVWIKELISSQLDADRMDYLQRDAYMCGVSYSHFDWKWIFENMEIREKESEDGGINEILVINGKKGVYSLESFIISRYHMHEQVYFHKTTRGFEGLLKKIFERVTYLIEKGEVKKDSFIDEVLFDFLVERIQNKNDLKKFKIESYLMLDDFFMLSQIELWSKKSTDEILKELSNCLANRIPFKMVHDADKKIVFDKMSEIQDSLGKENFKYFFFEDDPKSVIYKDTYISKGVGKEHIWLVNDGDPPKELSEYSPIIRTITNSEFQKERAYCHPQYYDQIMKILQN